ncbi:DUF2254 family protein [Sinomonas humi]|uniref:DUF2254 domain-containing protein n=1 Tax=Sinomonas humi TaxID=1338436 RepID=A0A0B2AHA9_9MICC|nr:DUF2254 family protein [Sinomonas humi]KHL01311.1 hypothetical protein LK10_16905 [Sinomonas humi]
MEQPPKLPTRLSRRATSRRRNASNSRSRLADVHRGELGEGIRLAFTEFLTLPLEIILGFLILEVAVFLLDHSSPPSLAPLRSFLEQNLFRDAQTTVNVLQTLAQTVITVVSITIPLLLVALQQAAAGLSSQVLDQFLRRRVNQVYAGFFIGLGVFCLLAASTSGPDRNPVYAAAVAVVFSIVAFVLFVMLFYTTMHQTRTPIILESIHDLSADARIRQQRWMKATAPAPRFEDAPVIAPVRAETTGFVMHIDLEALNQVLRSCGERDEIVFRICIGSYVAYHDTIAEVHAETDEAAERLGQALELAVSRERLRNVDHIDAGYGVEELYDSGWTAASSAKHTPLAAINAIVNLRDLLARWGETRIEQSPTSRLVYTDNVPAILTDALESILRAASEARHPRLCAEVLKALSATFERLTDPLQQELEAIILRALPLLTGLPLAADTEVALEEVEEVLSRAGRTASAALVSKAREERFADERLLHAASERVAERTATPDEIAGARRLT